MDGARATRTARLPRAIVLWISTATKGLELTVETQLRLTSSTRDTRFSLLALRMARTLRAASFLIFTGCWNIGFLGAGYGRALRKLVNNN
jgi:hypothetical protein